MKLLTAFMTVLALLGFAAAASANCTGMHQPPPDETVDTTPIVPLPKAGS